MCALVITAHDFMTDVIPDCVGVLELVETYSV